VESSRLTGAMQICLGPVCIPIWAALPLFWACWYKLREWMTGKPPPAPAACQDGVCEIKEQDGDAGENPAKAIAYDETEWNRTTTKVIELNSEEDWKVMMGESNKGKPMVVDFTADWCKPCQGIKPKFAELCEEVNADGNRALFVSVDVDKFESIMGDCKVAAMPTFQIYRGGGRVAEVVGADESKLENMIREHTKKEAN